MAGKFQSMNHKASKWTLVRDLDVMKKRLQEIGEEEVTLREMHDKVTQ